ncbi:Alpha/Beta hydrolase protein [Chlamydoabsidia padenii]|nr:Alpha/Beta hydrolase protein [Chlamydoabsidia padenii]
MIPDHPITRLVVYFVALCQTSLAPCAFVYFIYYLYVSHVQTPLPYLMTGQEDGDHYYLLPTTIHYWLATEMMFYIFFQITRNRMQQIGPSIINSLTRKERRSLVSLCISTVDSVQEWLPGWFTKKDDNSVMPEFDEIYRENVIEWLSWAFFTAPLEDVLQHPDLLKEVEWMTNEVESTFQVKFPVGYNEHLHSKRINLDPVNAYHRPLVFYIGIQLMTLFYGTMVLQFGYGMKKYGPEAVHSNLLWNPVESSSYPPKRHRQQQPQHQLNHYHQPTKTNQDNDDEEEERISYWFRDGDRNKTPILFIHGIGAGLMCYAPFIHQLVQLDAPIFCIELPFVSMRCVEDVPTMEEIGLDIQEMLRRHDCRHAVFVGHSLGTAVASWTLQHLPKTVAGVVLLDPICFMLHYKDLCTNFVYRTPQTASESIVKYFAASELYISYYISRHFHWFQCALFVTPINDERRRKNVKRNSRIGSTATLATTTMPRNTKIYLSECDNIVNSPQIYSYLSKQGMNTEMMTGLDHASFLMHPTWQKHIISTISEYIHSD